MFTGGYTDLKTGKKWKTVNEYHHRNRKITRWFYTEIFYVPVRCAYIWSTVGNSMYVRYKMSIILHPSSIINHQKCISDKCYFNVSMYAWLIQLECAFRWRLKTEFSSLYLPGSSSVSRIRCKWLLSSMKNPSRILTIEWKITFLRFSFFLLFFE